MGWGEKEILLQSKAYKHAFKMQYIHGCVPIFPLLRFISFPRHSLSIDPQLMLDPVDLLSSIQNIHTLLDCGFLPQSKFCFCLCENSLKIQMQKTL